MERETRVQRKKKVQHEGKKQQRISRLAILTAVIYSPATAEIVKFLLERFSS